MRIEKMIYLAALFGALSCSKPDRDESTSKSIIESNDLVFENSDFYRTRVGALTDGKVKCTAFLTGPSVIFTAEHCINSENLNSLKFIVDKESFSTEILSIDRKSGIAELKVDNVFEGYFQFGKLTSEKGSLVAFNYQEMEIQNSRTCSVKRDKNYLGLLVHDCDSLPGMSGAPIFQNGKVIGVHLGALPMKNANGALEIGMKNHTGLEIPQKYIEAEGIFGKCNPWCHDAGIKDPTTDKGNVLEKIQDNAARVFGVAKNQVNRSAEAIDSFAKSIKINERAIYEAYMTSILVYNSTACLLSGGTGPGLSARTNPGMEYCASNACLCAFIAAYGVYERNLYFIEHGGVAESVPNKELLNHDGFVNAASNKENHRDALVATLGMIPEGFFGDLSGGIFWSNGGDAYCWIPHPKYVSGPVFAYKVDVHKMTKMRRDPACPGMT